MAICERREIEIRGIAESLSAREMAIRESEMQLQLKLVEVDRRLETMGNDAAALKEFEQNIQVKGEGERGRENEGERMRERERQGDVCPFLQFSLLDVENVMQYEH